jgi:hypothetical protein
MVQMSGVRAAWSPRPSVSGATMAVTSPASTASAKRPTTSRSRWEFASGAFA